MRLSHFAIAKEVRNDESRGCLLPRRNPHRIDSLDSTKKLILIRKVSASNLTKSKTRSKLIFISKKNNTFFYFFSPLFLL